MQHLHHEVADESHEAVLVELLGSGSELTEAPGVSQLAVGLGEVTEGFLVGVQLEAVITVFTGLNSAQEVLTGHAATEDVRSQQTKRRGGNCGSSSVRHTQYRVTSTNPGESDRRQTSRASKSARLGVRESVITRQLHRLTLEVVGGDPVRRRAKNVVDDLTEVLLGLRLRHNLVEAQQIRTPRLLFKRVGVAGEAPTDLVLFRIARRASTGGASRVFPSASHIRKHAVEAVERVSGAGIRVERSGVVVSDQPVKRADILEDLFVIHRFLRDKKRLKLLTADYISTGHIGSPARGFA